jgi:hypothetical protein
VNEELKGQLENMERENRGLKANRTMLRESVPFKNAQSQINSNNGSSQVRD